MSNGAVLQREYPAEFIQQRAALYSLLPSDNEMVYIIIGVAAVIVLLLVID